MTYSAAIEFLHRLRLFGANFGLENTVKLAEFAGNPHRELRFIHVAGTNGKGSTCAMLESIYRATGLRVGLFTSPHLVAFGERIQVDRQPVREDEVVRLVSEMRSLLRNFPEGGHPTFFEVVTVMALRYFSERRCELVIWETGMGGRLDATNIVTPLASVITNVQFDHQQWLGDTIDKIALEKAGIIKPGVPVITAANDPQALKAIAEVARQRQAILKVLDGSETRCPPLDGLRLPLAGEHQRLNAAVALEVVRTLSDQLPVSRESIVAGLSGVRWPGRMQVVTTRAGHEVVLDGAHNQAGAEALGHELRTQFPDRKPSFVVGILGDKDWKSVAAALAPLAGRFILVPVRSERTLHPKEMATICRQLNPAAAVTVYSSLREALAEIQAEPLSVITGSLYLVGEALELLELVPAARHDERRLNEWGAPLSEAKAGG